MGLEIVKEEIIRTAKRQEEALIAEGKKEIVRIMNEAEKKIAEIKEKSSAETKRIIDIIKKQELASAELENKKVILEAKKQVIESVFGEARKMLERLDTEKREIYMRKLIEKAKKDIEVANIYCSKKDIKLVKDFNAEAMSIMGGLIAENKDKTIRVDYSFDMMLENIKENELQNINMILFD